MRSLFLIPARGGSKGIPNKNLKPFCGESLVSRSVKQALQCASPDDTVFVSTDSPLIREEAEGAGAKVDFLRPPHLATDTASTHSVIIHVLEEFKKRGMEFDRVVLLQPTSPFRKIDDIKATMKVWNPSIDMAVSVNISKANPYFNLFEQDKDGYLKLSKGSGEFSRRQDSPKVWEYNGAVYVITTSSVLESPMSRFRKILPYEMPVSRSIDLDSPEDWTLAELIYQQTEKK